MKKNVDRPGDQDYNNIPIEMEVGLCPVEW
jgi:hypothetical protein